MTFSEYGSILLCMTSSMGETMMLWSTPMGGRSSCLRLNGMHNNLYLIHRLDMRQAFEHTFESFWNNDSHTLVEDQSLVLANIKHVLGGVPGGEAEP